MRGIILAGGSGTRLYPITVGVSKQLLPVYDKPMIYYPLSVLMLAGIKKILLITMPQHQDAFIRLLGDGSRFGIEIQYEIQPSPDGLAQAFIIGKRFINGDDVCLVLGDNIFYGQGLTPLLKSAVSSVKSGSGASLFVYRVKDPENFGVVEFGSDSKVISIEEKPKHARSNFAITGLYFFDNEVVEIAEGITPSARNELEITSIINVYLNSGRLRIETMGRGFAWLDAGTHDSLVEASSFVRTIEQRQGMKVACLEEIAYQNGWISPATLEMSAAALKGTGYGEHLLEVLKR